MKIVLMGKYFHVYPAPEDHFDASLLLGWKRRKGDSYVTAEDNVINRMVLGEYPNWRHTAAEPNNVEGLKPFQVKDITKMRTLQHFLNANPMGLGKTVETIRYLQAQGAASVLIVCPKIIREQWRDQLRTWGGYDATVYERQPQVKPGIWIVNYDKLRNWDTLLKFKAFQWEYLILDEAHKIKSRTAQQTIAVKSIPAYHRIALTGTPILRYVDDLWSLLNFLSPQYACISYHVFVNYFCTLAQTPWGDKIVGLTHDERKVTLLNQLMDAISIRNNAIEVAHGKTREVVKLPMTRAQRDLYRKERQLLLDELPEGCTIANGAVLTLRLMQTTSWPGLFIPGEVGPKFEWILGMCQNNPHEKIVVFSVFEKTATAFTRLLNQSGVSACSITGKNTAEENAFSKRCFVEGKAQVLLGTIKAMGQGYDELQKVSHTMVFVDRDWSPEIMNQAEDRLHRMGQDNLVNIYYLECSGSFDQHVGRINANKAEDIREALKSDEKHSGI